MPLGPIEATQVAQLLGQYHDVARFAVEATRDPGETAAALLARVGAQNPLAGAVFGFAVLSFVYTFDAVVKEENFPAGIMAVVDLGVLNIARNNVAPNEQPNEACLRHLRNCFAHGRFRVHVLGPGNVEVEMHDVNAAGNPTFDARCAAEHVIELAERLLVAAHDHAAGIAQPPAVAPAPAAAPAAVPPPGAGPAEGA